ncbi:MAG: DNA mismatch repair endonuclease MutL [Nitrospirota bacterium]|nr:DNA mismatch repair endonuclease MutL [Nitrospirota bacterium]
MPQIKILPPDLRNKIAAGEVIERPASVVKELIENSIDAESTNIRIDILYGGKRLIRVSDNGTGMDKEDALLAFERHATSKLVTEDDLFNIKTMGFRGEALSSIASVSKVKLITGHKNSPPHPPLSKGGTRGGVGISVEIYGGEVKEIKDSPSIGTSVEVRDLFFNTPARKKFLKSNSTELFHIIDTVTKEALSHWEIGFRLTHNNQETINLPPSSYSKERIMQVYGDEFFDSLIELNNPPRPPLEKRGEGGFKRGGQRGEINVKMNAFVTKGENFRNSRSHQFIFINKRPIKDQSLSHAVYNAYEGILPRDKHPVFFLFLDIDPRKVDFNVHPTKREVRFEDKESIYRFVNSGIRETVRGERTEYIKQFTEIPASSPYPLSLTPQELMVSETPEFAYKPHLPFIYLGDTFIAISGKGGLTLVDHHAAHERILYEKFLKGINLNSHQLLFPRQVKLSPKEYRILLDNVSILRDFGIEVDDFGHETVIVRSLPDVLKETDIRGILSDVSSCIIEGVAPDKSLKEVLAARIACHSSVRGEEILNQEELSNLISDLEQADQPDQCPHGRPTRIFLSLDHLKKMFKRK